MQGLQTEEAELRSRLTALDARRETAGGEVTDLEARRAERDRLVTEIAAATGALQGLQTEEAELRSRPDRT